MNANPVFSLHIPTKILFGCGELRKLATEKLPGKKALIVISSGTSMKKYGYLDKVVELLQENNTESVVYDKILPNPIKSHVMEAASVCREQKCDFIVGLGGGSVITNEEAKEKIGFGSTLTFPVLSIIDPELMVSIPPHLTAYQGFDAFFHAAEGFLANCATPISDLYALEAIRLLYKYLPVAVKDGRNLKARAKVAWASTLAGLVEATSCCISEHSMEHAMSAFHPELPHGAGLIAISEAYFETFRNDCMKRYMKMAEIMTQQKSNRPSDFIDALVRMQKECNVYQLKLSDWGVKEEELPLMVQNARDTMGSLFTLDPRPLTDEEVLQIYQKSFR